MTSRDVMEAGDSLHPDPNWPGLDGSLDVSEFDPTTMRSIANHMRTCIPGMDGPGTPEGSLASIRDHCQLTEAQLGQWNTARAFSQTVGAPSGGKKFEKVYQEFVEAYKNVIAAIEASADNLDKANHASGDR
jgi:hypothetical protein